MRGSTCSTRKKTTTLISPSLQLTQRKKERVGVERGGGGRCCTAQNQQLPKDPSCKLVSQELVKKEGWWSAPCFLSSLLIPHSSGWKKNFLWVYMALLKMALFLFQPSSVPFFLHSSRNKIILHQVMVGNCGHFFSNLFLA